MPLFTYTNQRTFPFKKRRDLYMIFNYFTFNNGIHSSECTIHLHRCCSQSWNAQSNDCFEMYWNICKFNYRNSGANALVYFCNRIFMSSRTNLVEHCKRIRRLTMVIEISDRRVELGLQKRMRILLVCDLRNENRIWRNYAIILLKSV